MAIDRIGRIERMLNRALTATEKERLLRIQSTLGMADNDALWDVITALEYQRTFYDDLPRKIGSTATEILQGITTAAEKEAAAAQARLTDSVVKQAQRLSAKINYTTLLPMGMAALVCMMIFGSLMLWAGYCIAAGQVQPLAWWLDMPSGFLIAGLLFATGLYCGVLAAKSYSELEKGWYKMTLVALCFSCCGSVFFAYTLPHIK